MDLPEFINKYLAQAKRLLDEQSVKDIVFSGGFYQIEVYDPIKKRCMTVEIQLDKNNHVEPVSCQCSKQKECIHLAVGCLAIFDGQKEPLEIRHEKSFWYHLLFVLAKQIGFTTRSLQTKSPDSYESISDTKETIFELVLKSKSAKQKFKEIFKDITLEKDVVPFQASNISEEERLKWKQGKASSATQFELSFWASLAKWFSFLQSRKVSYRIIFDTKTLPQNVHIEWKDLLTMNIDLSSFDLSEIIESLKSVHSNLRVFDELSETIQSIRYDEEKKAFQILKKEKKEKKIEGEKIGKWIYVKDKGFYSISNSPLLEKEWIDKEEIPNVLSSLSDVFDTYLENISIYKQEHIAKYHLYFDAKDQLHILTFPHQQEEALNAKSAFFPPWYYVPSKGFYRMKDYLFEQKHKVVLKEEVSSFIQDHKTWIQAFEGFEMHSKIKPAQFEYRVNKNQELEFFLKLAHKQDVERYIDFEDWFYVQSHGFYLKKGFSIRPGLILTKEEMGSFIEQHEEELEEVHGFFAKQNPIEKDMLRVKVIDQKVHVLPSVVYKKGYDATNVQFFFPYVYVEKEGFSKLLQHEVRRKYPKDTVIEESQIPYFLTNEISRLSSIEIDKQLRKPKKLRAKIHQLKKEKRKAKIFWKVSLAYRSELGEVNILDLKQEIDQHKKYAFTKAGLIHLEDSRFGWIAELKKSQISARQKSLRLTTLEWLRLCLIEEISPPRAKTKQAQEIRSLFKDLAQLESNRLLDLTYLRSKLRPYQEIGVQWLWFLYAHNLSGLLCDDMGLGKTHQAMALLAAILKEDQEKTNKYLVLCPTSVIYHWEELIQKYLPEMRVLTYYGMERSLDTFEQQYDLLLTSYGILRLGKESLKGYQFEVAIFDEMQIAKNPLSQTYQAMKKIRSNMKLGLSGTPIENNLKELKALFEMILPGYLPLDKEFREKYIDPIEKNHDQKQKKELSELIRPFILRRKKQDVLKDLPEKIEEIAYCRLSEEQQTLYNQTLQEKREEILDTLEKEQEPIPYLHIFALLSKLKQICNHPSLALKDPSSYQNHKSGKWELFVELLEEARQSKQKLVVFSQYTNMLEIIERYLKKQKIVYASIKGSTRKRQFEIHKFRDDPNCEVFVASLLAAGVGIDLTAGSIVIHYDRWWNPAKENQATDRVHRIGQNRGVQVFKLVTKNTIEEDIHALIERKSTLTEELIGKDDHDQIKRLSREDLKQILQKRSFQI